MDGACAGVIIAVTLIKHREFDILFHQFVDGMFQASRHELVFQGDGEHDHLIIVAGFEFGHRNTSTL